MIFTIVGSFWTKCLPFLSTQPIHMSSFSGEHRLNRWPTCILNFERAAEVFPLYLFMFWSWPADLPQKETGWMLTYPITQHNHDLLGSSGERKYIFSIKRRYKQWNSWLYIRAHNKWKYRVHFKWLMYENSHHLLGINQEKMHTSHSG